MVGIREKVFLISGNYFSQRKRALESIKKRLSKDKATSINNLTFYSKEIKLKDFGPAVFTSSFDKSKVIIFKNFQDLSFDVRTFIFNNLNKIILNNYLIFETDKDRYQLEKTKSIAKDKLFNFILTKAASFKVASAKREISIDDFFTSIRNNDLVNSLYILDKLFEGSYKDKIIGPKIIGILVSKFSYLKDCPDKNRYFNYLWQADRAIKEKGHPPRLVIETLLVKLLKSNQ